MLCKTKKKFVFRQTFVKGIRPDRVCGVMLAGKSGKENTTWCYRLWSVILLEPTMLKLTMHNWTFQINSMRAAALVSLIDIGRYQNLDRMSWRSIHCPLSMASRWVRCVRYWGGNGYDHCGYIAMGISLWVCPYWCMWVRVGSGARSLAVRSQMFVLSEQGGYKYCWIW